MPEYLLADIGSTFTKMCLVDAENAEVRAHACAPTTIAEDVNLGFEAALHEIAADETAVEATLVCSSAAGGLRISAVGLTPELTLRAAQFAALGAGAKVVQAFSFKLTKADLTSLRAEAPDIVLLAGGTDGGNTKYILQNAALLQREMPGTPIILAGNRQAVDELEELFAGRDDVYVTENVMPAIETLNLEPVRETIREVFLNRIVQARGLNRLESRARVLMPTPEAVFRAVGLLARGVDGRDGLGDLMMVDIGGATTDVYSCASGDPQSAGTVLKGLREPYEKRTVEGDVGMRHTLGYLLEAASSETLAADCGVAPDAVAAWAARVAERPEILAETPEERRIDAACARAGCRIAVRRHCGRLEETFTPDGRLYVQRGKDLRAVPTVVGSGGALVWPDAAADILSGVRRGENEEALMPEKPALLLDARYTMWAAGLLAEREPRAALAMMKKNLVPVACGDPETPKGAAPLSREE